MSVIPFVKHRAAFTHILVALDESEPAGWALDLGIRMAKESKATVSAVHVVDPPRRTFESASDIGLLKLAASNDQILNSAREHIPQDLAGELLVREGEPKREIVEAARDLGADLIVIGTHGRNAFERFLLGSTTESVVREAPCPVLTVSQAPTSEIVESHDIPKPYEVANSNPR